MFLYKFSVTWSLVSNLSVSLQVQYDLEFSENLSVSLQVQCDLEFSEQLECFSTSSV